MIKLDEFSRPSDVLRFAAEHGDKSWVYIITGRPGPTGKTHLYNNLRKNGYNAIEISEDISSLVDYRSNTNRYIVDYLNKKVVVVLNERLKGSNITPSAVHENVLFVGTDVYEVIKNNPDETIILGQGEPNMKIKVTGYGE